MNDERLNTIRNACEEIGMICLLTYILASINGERALLPHRVFLSFIAVIAYSLKTGIEISSGEKYSLSAFFVIISVFYGVVSLILMV